MASRHQGADLPSYADSLEDSLEASDEADEAAEGGWASRWSRTCRPGKGGLQNFASFGEEVLYPVIRHSPSTIPYHL